jgi:hypothetical protein
MTPSPPPKPCEACENVGRLDVSWSYEDHIQELHALIADLQREKGELVAALEGAMVQACMSHEPGSEEIDSMALSYYAQALRLLSKLGRFNIEHEAGRRVIGHFVEPAVNLAKQEGGA